jgi:hypothetical protein
MGFHIATASSLLWRILLPPTSETIERNLQTALYLIGFLVSSLEMQIDSFSVDYLKLNQQI